MEIGITVDFRNYNEYYTRFCKDFNRKKCPLEFHIPVSDINNKLSFEKKIKEVTSFLEKNNLEKISFHCPDTLINDIFLYELFTQGEFIKGRGQKIPSKQEAFLAKDTLSFLIGKIDEVSETLDKRVVLVVHQGGFFSEKFLHALTKEELMELRKVCLERVKGNYHKLLKLSKSENLLISLESSPPMVASRKEQHFIDQVFEDFKERLGEKGAFVADVSHIALCVEYFKKKREELVPGLETARAFYAGIPHSLKSLENYLHLAKNNIAWFHLSDANGFGREDEGLPIKDEKSIIDWPRLMIVIQKNFKEPVGVLEINGAEKDYLKIKRSMEFLNKIKGWDKKLIETKKQKV